jgi:hypothetical protein
MRLKLVFVSSLIAAIVGAGSVIAIILSVFSSLEPVRRPGLVVVSTFLIPALATLFAAVFVYRHTARRRKVQAALTALIALLLALAVLVLASIYSAPREPLPSTPPQAPPANVS